ncbi:MAG: hypothetical protein IJH39_05960 [Clostridia bacterium]|nr:hypothetical protein [Clostridia bacterium]
MINNLYAKAYKEVLEIIKYFPEEEYNKIPQEKIEFYKMHMDNDYIFSIDPKIDLAKQNISKEASAIIVTLFRDYFSTEEQKKKLEEIIKLNEIKSEIEKNKRYNSDDLFKYNNKAEDIKQVNIKENDLVEYKDNFFTKFKNFILKLLHIK